MKTYQKQIKPAQEHEVLVQVKCDLCGKTSAGNWSADWKENSYDATETEVRMRTGSNYHEGGNGDEITIDICPDCFTTKLIPWVKAHGGEPTKKEWEW
jgi:hypothetical protein